MLMRSLSLSCRSWLSRASRPNGDQIRSFENRRPDGCEGPAVAEHAEEPVLRKTSVVPVPDDQVVAFEHQPERNGENGEQRELARRRSHPRSAARAVHDGVGEDDEAGPADRGVPRIERLDARERRRFGRDHDGEADDGRGAHVTRILYEQPLSVGLPTFLPRIRTLWLLPSPPGITSVLSSRVSRTERRRRSPPSRRPSKKYV